MSGLRSLLRLDDKVAAEGRRLKHVGGPSLRWLAPLTIVAALLLHGAILLLPAVSTKATLPPASAAPSFPLVWREVVEPPPAPEPAGPLPPVHPASPPAARPAAMFPAAPGLVSFDESWPPPAPPRVSRPLNLEPLAEPDSELALSKISVQVEAIIPNPDSPPPSADLGPPLGAAGGVVEAPPSAIEHVSPIYPVAAKSLRAEGHVTLHLTVLPDGSVSGATVESCSRPGLGFEAAAIAAVKRWRYEPASPQLGPRKVTVTVHFQRQEGRP